MMSKKVRKMLGTHVETDRHKKKLGEKEGGKIGRGREGKW